MTGFFQSEDEYLASLTGCHAMDALTQCLDRFRQQCLSIARLRAEQPDPSPLQASDSRRDVERIARMNESIRATHARAVELSDLAALAAAEKGVRIVGHFKGQSYAHCALKLAGAASGLHTEWRLTEFTGPVEGWNWLAERVAGLFDGIDWQLFSELVRDEWRTAFPDQPPETTFPDQHPKSATTKSDNPNPKVGQTDPPNLQGADEMFVWNMLQRSDIAQINQRETVRKYMKEADPKRWGAVTHEELTNAADILIRTVKRKAEK